MESEPQPQSSSISFNTGSDPQPRSRKRNSNVLQEPQLQSKSISSNIAITKTLQESDKFFESLTTSAYSSCSDAKAQSAHGLLPVTAKALPRNTAASVKSKCMMFESIAKSSGISSKPPSQTKRNCMMFESIAKSSGISSKSPSQTKRKCMMFESIAKSSGISSKPPSQTKRILSKTVVVEQSHLFKVPSNVGSEHPPQSNNVSSEPLPPSSRNTSTIFSEPLPHSSFISSSVASKESSISPNLISKPPSLSYIISSDVELVPLSQSSCLSSQKAELELCLSFINSFLESETVSQSNNISSEVLLESFNQSNMVSEPLSQSSSAYLSESLSLSSCVSSNMELEQLSPSSSISSYVVSEVQSHASSISSNLASEPLFPSSIASHSSVISSNVALGPQSPSSYTSLNVTSKVQSPSSSIFANVASESESQTSRSSLKFENVSVSPLRNISSNVSLNPLSHLRTSSHAQSSSISSSVTSHLNSHTPNVVSKPPSHTLRGTPNVPAKPLSLPCSSDSNEFQEPLSEPMRISSNVASGSQSRFHQGTTLRNSKSHSQSVGCLNLESLKTIPQQSSHSGEMSLSEERVSETGSTSSTRHSEPVNLLRSTLKQRVKESGSTLVSICDGIEIRTLKMNQEYTNFEKQVKKLSFGTTRIGYATKTILLLGAVGAGKTALINAMVNFLYGIQFDDDFRLKVPEENSNEGVSNAEFVTAYVFHYVPGMCSSYTFVLIDTPGFGDTRGIQYDRLTIEKINDFLMFDDLAEISRVCFVQALTGVPIPTQTYVFDGLMSVFGNDIFDAVNVMVTFADNVYDNLEVTKILEEAGVTSDKKYNFNNSHLYNKGNIVHDIEKNRSLWLQRYDVLAKFFSDIRKSVAVSLLLTREVVQERRLLNEDLSTLLRYICPCQTFNFKRYSVSLRRIVGYLQSFLLDDSKLIEQDVIDTVKQHASGSALSKCQTIKSCWCSHEGNARRQAKAAKGPEEEILDFVNAIAKRMKKLEDISFKIDPLICSHYIDDMINVMKEMHYDKNVIQILQEKKGKADLIREIRSLWVAKSSQTQITLQELLQHVEISPPAKVKQSWFKGSLRKKNMLRKSVVGSAAWPN